MLKLHASAANMWVKCPASVAMQDKFKREDADSPAAREGRVAHNDACRALKAETWEKEDGNEISECAGIYAQIVKDYVLKGYVIEGVEKAYKTEWMGAESNCYIDCVLKKDDTLIVLDYKYGRFPIETFENYQLLTYAISYIESQTCAINKIKLVIVQPRAICANPNKPKIWEISKEDLETYKTLIRKKAGDAQSTFPTLQVGGHCRYCDARHACPQLQKEAIERAEASLLKIPEALSPEALSRELIYLTETVDIIGYRKTALEEKALQMLKKGVSIPEFGVEETWSRLGWDLKDEEILALGALNGVDLKKPSEPITPSKALKIKGIEGMVRVCSSRKPAGVKLIRENINKIKEVFKNE